MQQVRKGKKSKEEGKQEESDPKLSYPFCLYKSTSELCFCSLFTKHISAN